jgi:hypothetical protein
MIKKYLEQGKEISDVRFKEMILEEIKTPKKLDDIIKSVNLKLANEGKRTKTAYEFRNILDNLGDIVHCETIGGNRYYCESVKFLSNKIKIHEI